MAIRPTWERVHSSQPAAEAAETQWPQDLRARMLLSYSTQRRREENWCCRSVSATKPTRNLVLA